MCYERFGNKREEIRYDQIRFHFPWNLEIYIFFNDLYAGYRKVTWILTDSTNFRYIFRNIKNELFIPRALTLTQHKKSYRYYHTFIRFRCDYFILEEASSLVTCFSFTDKTSGALMTSYNEDKCQNLFFTGDVHYFSYDQ